MESEQRLRIRNTRAGDLAFYLEPWGDLWLLAPGVTLDLVASGPAGSFEVEHGDDRVTVYGWSGSVVTVSRDGHELDGGGGQRVT